MRPLLLYLGYQMANERAHLPSYEYGRKQYDLLPALVLKVRSEKIQCCVRIPAIRVVTVGYGSCC